MLRENTASAPKAPSTPCLCPCSLREQPHGSGWNFPRDFGWRWGHKAQLRGHRGARSIPGLPCRLRDPGRRRHPASSPLDGATNPAWSRRRASPAVPSVPSPGCCVSRWPGGLGGWPRERPAPFPHLRLCVGGTAQGPRGALGSQPPLVL